MSDLEPPKGSPISDILEPWRGFVHSEYDGTNQLDEQLAVVTEAEQALTALLEAAIGSEKHTGVHGLLGWNLSTCQECRNLQIKQKLGIPNKETNQ